MAAAAAARKLQQSSQPYYVGQNGAFYPVNGYTQGGGTNIVQSYQQPYAVLQQQPYAQQAYAQQPYAQQAYAQLAQQAYAQQAYAQQPYAYAQQQQQQQQQLLQPSQQQYAVPRSSQTIPPPTVSGQAAPASGQVQAAGGIIEDVVQAKKNLFLGPAPVPIAPQKTILQPVIITEQAAPAPPMVLPTAAPAPTTISGPMKVVTSTPVSVSNPINIDAGSKQVQGALAKGFGMGGPLG